MRISRGFRVSIKANQYSDNWRRLILMQTLAIKDVTAGVYGPETDQTSRSRDPFRVLSMHDASLVSVSSRRYVQMYRSRLGLECWRDRSRSRSRPFRKFRSRAHLLFSLKFTCDDSLLKLSALISSIAASTIIRAECSRTLLSVLHRCDIYMRTWSYCACWSEE